MSVTPEKLLELRAEFPRNAVSWRAQNVTQAGDKALALAYIDARDVMNRLDEICGPENWQDSYVETAKGRIIGTISINVDGLWISKSDGAGETDIEGDKGGMSDSLKRTAVKWGIGRYLYDIESPWVPCECWPEKNSKGKFVWKKWKADPWSCVRGAPPASVDVQSPPELPAVVQAALDAIDLAETSIQLKAAWEKHWANVPKDHRPAVLNAKEKRKTAIEAMGMVNA